MLSGVNGGSSLPCRKYDYKAPLGDKAFQIEVQYVLHNCTFV